jgi:hypothetical protein
MSWSMQLWQGAATMRAPVAADLVRLDAARPAGAAWRSGHGQLAAAPSAAEVLGAVGVISTKSVTPRRRSRALRLDDAALPHQVAGVVQRHAVGLRAGSTAIRPDRKYSVHQLQEADDGNDGRRSQPRAASQRAAANPCPHSPITRVRQLQRSIESQQPLRAMAPASALCR